MRTAVATIGIRGTEFDARLCSTDCADEAKQRPGPAGRAGFVRGSVVASAGGGARSRSLVAGDSVYNGDRIVTGEGAYAVLAFRDKSRVTVLPNTEFHVENFEYNAAQPERGRSGVRAVTRWPAGGIWLDWQTQSPQLLNAHPRCHHWHPRFGI